MFGLTPYDHRRGNGVAKRDEFGSFGSLFDNFFNDAWMPAFFSSGAHPIRADIRETEKEYIVEAEVPGVRKEDIKLDLRDDVLTISVEHNEQLDEERENFVRKERRVGSYSRSFYVENIKHEEVKANYTDGILSITLPKQEGGKEKRHRIEIQ